MRHVTKAIVLALPLTLAGCMSTHENWVKEGVTEAQRQLDFRRCQNEATKEVGMMQGASLAGIAMMEEEKTLCMMEKGYVYK